MEAATEDVGLAYYLGPFMQSSFQRILCFCRKGHIWDSPICNNGSLTAIKQSSICIQEILSSVIYGHVRGCQLLELTFLSIQNLSNLRVHNIKRLSESPHVS